MRRRLPGGLICPSRAGADVASRLRTAYSYFAAEYTYVCPLSSPKRCERADPDPRCQPRLADDGHLHRNRRRRRDGLLHPHFLPLPRPSSHRLASSHQLTLALPCSSSRSTGGRTDRPRKRLRPRSQRRRRRRPRSPTARNSTRLCRSFALRAARGLGRGSGARWGASDLNLPSGPRDSSTRPDHNTLAARRAEIFFSRFFFFALFTFEPFHPSAWYSFPLMNRAIYLVPCAWDYLDPFRER